jgi:hypothetical protein
MNDQAVFARSSHARAGGAAARDANCAPRPSAWPPRARPPKRKSAKCNSSNESSRPAIDFGLQAIRQNEELNRVPTAGTVAIQGQTISGELPNPIVASVPLASSLHRMRLSNSGRGIRRLLSRPLRASVIVRRGAPEAGTNRNATARGFVQVQAVPPPPRTCARSSRHRGQILSSARQTSNHKACPRGLSASMKEHG